LRDSEGLAPSSLLTALNKERGTRPVDKQLRIFVSDATQIVKTESDENKLSYGIVVIYARICLIFNLQMRNLRVISRRYDRL